MADRPIEYELMMSTYTQLGQELSNNVDQLDVFVPSGVEEDELGFDMQVQNLKGLVFQFKRPKGGDPHRFSVRYSNKDPPRQLDRMQNWELKFGPYVAFYALPLVIEHDSLGRTLKRTAFIPASAIDELASVIRIPTGYIEDGKRNTTESAEVYCSHPNDPSENTIKTINSTSVLGWEELETAVGECEFGFWLRRDGQSCSNRYHEDYDWYPRAEEIRGVVPTDKAESRDERFVGFQGPIFTRLGDENSFGW